MSEAKKYLRVPKRYRVKVGDAIELGCIEYTVMSVDKGFESGVWHKGLTLEHNADHCRACAQHRYCGAGPCPAAEDAVLDAEIVHP